MAKVLAAVDQARTRHPVYGEGARSEETRMEYEYAQRGLCQSATEFSAEKRAPPAEQQVVTTTVRKETVIVPTETQISYDEQAEKHISQVRLRLTHKTLS